MNSPQVENEGRSANRNASPQNGTPFLLAARVQVVLVRTTSSIRLADLAGYQSRGKQTHNSIQSLSVLVQPTFNPFPFLEIILAES
jgi:hypothetical protein